MIKTLYEPFQHWSADGSVYILSDLHFDDEDCKLMDTNWVSPDEQVRIINSVVMKNDTFVCLGDVGNVKYVAQIKAKKKILLLGNHDSGASTYKEYFDEVYTGPLFISDKILLSHEPVYGLPWCINIHGHDHNNIEKYMEGCKHINLAANVCGYKPVNLGKLIKEGILSDISSIHRTTIDAAKERSNFKVNSYKEYNAESIYKLLPTIQDVIRGFDIDEIEKAFFYEHPIHIHELTKYADETIGDFKIAISKRFHAFAERLCNMEIVNDSGKQGVLFVYKSQTESLFLETDVGLIHVDELMEAEDLAKMSTYAYEFTNQAEALSFLVSDAKLTQDNLMDVVVSFLFEVSFFGYEQEDLAENLESLHKSIEEIEEHPENLVSFSSDELREEWGLPKEEIYPGEEQRKDSFYKAGMEYTNYCKMMELQKMKNRFIDVCGLY